RVSILVPAFNEEGTVVEALRSTIDIDYPDFEVIVVDDGSTDKTFERAASLAGRHRDRVDVQVLRKENAGKWSAHNFAVRHATGRYLLCVDADSRLEPDALRHMVRAIERDESIAAVAGQVRVRNRDGLLTCLQALEYLTCNGSMRTAQSFDATVLVVPGPIGLFRREVLDRVTAEFGKRGYDGTGGRYDGPFEDDSFAEDFDLSLAVLQLGYGIVYEPRAVSNTKAPSTLRSLMNQRYRWQRGSIQVLRKVMRRSRERPELLRPALLRWLLLAYAVDFVLVPLWLLIGLPYLLALYLSGSAIATSLLGFLLLMFGTNFLLSLCYASTHKDSKWLAPLCVAHDVYNTCFLQAILIFVVFDEIRGTPMRWS
ncbi:MAG TPA: glycosyltransferase family 2 protein, partial [Planctomycetota bacterium]|nr:glycosyltransferase family 2 protein [Planctomycetota bacterium]